jgi:hypothetical protein
MGITFTPGGIASAMLRFEELITTPIQRRATVLAAAQEFHDRQQIVLGQVADLRLAAADADTPWDLLGRKHMRRGLEIAAGVGATERRLLTTEEIDLAIHVMVEDCLLPAGAEFANALALKYLVSTRCNRSEQLASSIPFLSREQFCLAMTAALRRRSIATQIKWHATGQWGTWNPEDLLMGTAVQGLAWAGHDRPRTLLFNSRVGPHGKKFAVVLRRFTGSRSDQSANENATSSDCLGFGDIGGFETAADRWEKKGQVAAKEVHRSFEAGQGPQGFFIGCDISEATAKELWSDLHSGVISQAANVRCEEQLDAVCEWLIEL